MKSGDVYNEKILDLPKRKVLHLAHCDDNVPYVPAWQKTFISTAHCLPPGDLAHVGAEQLPHMQIIAMLFTGAAPLYLMSTTYVLVGALLGCPMGAEFKAALEAAWQVGCLSSGKSMS